MYSINTRCYYLHATSTRFKIILLLKAFDKIFASHQRLSHTIQ